MKKQIELIKRMYKYENNLYYDLDSCLDKVILNEINDLLEKNHINNLTQFIGLLIVDNNFQKEVNEALDRNNSEVVRNPTLMLRPIFSQSSPNFLW